MHADDFCGEYYGEAIKEKDLQFLAESAYADACAPGNPKNASVEDLKDLFRKILCNLKKFNRMGNPLKISPGVSGGEIFV